MKPLIAALLLALGAAPAMAGDVVDTSFVKAEGVHAFNVRDLVMMDRVSDPQLSPDGRHAAFGVAAQTTTRTRVSARSTCRTSTRTGSR